MTNRVTINGGQHSGEMHPANYKLIIILQFSTYPPNPTILPNEEQNQYFKYIIKYDQLKNRVIIIAKTKRNTKIHTGGLYPYCSALASKTACRSVRRRERIASTPD
eukprot:TRINITY_DN4012_c1_g3_i1.p3 TRINITY_DN4012_c1_g3~~TRINITY_DN4012_c1_g3_i1.p3  ORF type:complete len:106 (+),score=0.64 TRINITY_DN4012_c1_g3_i1:279-596(+)